MTGRAGKLLPWISTAVAIVVVIAIWKLVIAVFNVSPFVLPQPEDVLSGVRDLVQSKNLWSDARVTLEETLVGFAIALVLGLALGIVLGRVTWLEQVMLKTRGDTMVMETEEIGGAAPRGARSCRGRRERSPRWAVRAGCSRREPRRAEGRAPRRPRARARCRW